jgi:hypothetical protein
MFSATRGARPGTLRRVGQQMRNASTHGHAEHTPEEKVQPRAAKLRSCTAPACVVCSALQALLGDCG